MIKTVIKKIPGVQSIIEYRNAKYNEKMCQLLQKEGQHSLEAYYRVGERLGIHFDVMFGTLLGVYRDHSFIPHDDDIDMVCNIKHLNQQLIDTLRAEGFVIERIYVASDRKGVQLPMKYNGLTSDIYFMYDDKADQEKKHIFIPLAIEGHEWGYSSKLNIFSVKDMNIPYTENRIKVPFLDKEIEIVANADNVLKTLYGNDYMTPKANAHANPPVSYYSLGEKYYTCYPIILFEENNIIKCINMEPIETHKHLVGGVNSLI